MTEQKKSMKFLQWIALCKRAIKILCNHKLHHAKNEMLLILLVYIIATKIWKYSQFYSKNLFLFVTMNCHVTVCWFAVRCLSVIFVSPILFVCTIFICDDSCLILFICTMFICDDSCIILFVCTIFICYDSCLILFFCTIFICDDSCIILFVCIIFICILACWILCVFFWVVPRRLIYICRRFGTLYLFHFHRQVWINKWRWKR